MALSSLEYKDVEFKGSFESAMDTDDDWIGFVFGYQDPGHFFIVLAPGDWQSHVASKLDKINHHLYVSIYIPYYSLHSK